MKTYELSVFIRLITEDIVVHVFQIQVAQTIAWVKEHADEITGKAIPDGFKNYCALNVKEA